MKDAPLRHRAEYGAFLTLDGLVRALPHRLARPLGRRIGDLAFLLLADRRRIALENLRLAFPERPPAELRRLARGCFRHLGAACTDALSAERFDPVKLCRRLTLEGWENLAAAPAGGSLLMSAHLGLWEIAALAVGLYRGGLHVVGRPLDNPHLERRLQRLRTRYGNRMIPRRGAVREMFRALGQGGRVGILIDQRARPGEGIPVPFFGRPARTSPVLARLSLRTAAPVIPVFGFPAPAGRYRVVVRPPVEPGPDGEEAAARLTARYMAVVEREIRRRPEQWLWMHRLWEASEGDGR